MGNPTSPLQLPTFPVETVNLSKLNLAGYYEDPKIQAAIENVMAQNRKYADELEKRYEQPNWFKVAAGFAKPQLGGFTASLGSAAEALGETLEQQRMVAPTVAQMRAKTSVMEATLGQQEHINRLMLDWRTKHPGEPYPPSIISKATEFLGESHPLAKAAQTFQATTGTQQQQLIEAQKALAENPSIVLSNPFFKSLGIDASPEAAKKAVENLNMARPKDMTPEVWNSMSTSAKLDALGAYNNRLATQGMDEEQKSAFTARASDNILNDLTYLRTLAVDPKMAPLFSIFKNGDAISMFRSFLDQNQGNVSRAVEGMVAAASDALKNADNETRQKADKLIKGIARLEVNLRGSNVNPTNAFQELNMMASPNLANSQAGFVGILDQMGLQAKHEIDRHSLRIDSNIPARRILSSDESRALENRYRDEAERLASSNALTATPSWYRPTNVQRQTAPTTRPSATTPATTTAAPAAGSTLERLRQERSSRP